MGDFVRIGVLFDDPRHQKSFSGQLELGLLGEVKIWARFNRSRRGGKDYLQLIALKKDCPSLLNHEKNLIATYRPPGEDPDEAYWEYLLSLADTWEEPEEPETPPAQEELWATTAPS